MSSVSVRFRVFGCLPLEFSRGMIELIIIDILIMEERIDAY